MRRELLSVFLLSCAGPAAPDAALCQDVIQRLCAVPRCATTQVKLGVGDDCEAVLLTRTGCAQDEFAFTAPTREKVLECRLPLIRFSDSRLLPPGCDNVDETWRACPELVTFLGGTP